MAKTAVISVRIDPELKRKAEQIFTELGLTTSQAIMLFFKQVELQRGLPFSLKIPVVGNIVSGEELKARYRDHALVGQYKGTRECHIEPDWLLIYELAPEEIVLIRTGSHADLFG